MCNRSIRPPLFWGTIAIPDLWSEVDLFAAPGWITLPAIGWITLVTIRWITLLTTGWITPGDDQWISLGRPVTAIACVVSPDWVTTPRERSHLLSSSGVP